ncbi:MAG: class I SAM-dependent methyltransferase [Candidatus Thiodiazotropha sp. (ex Lucinoma borealis)]|nr:class I SAM-dependent methyltransferase [Candidatus Thiodiazotropha sp. (ex Lucinoma borealis)]
MTQSARTIEPLSASPQPDLATIKAKMKATWEDGDYADFARYMESGAKEILDGWQLPSGKHLLDIGCGAGQTAIPAARRGLHVTGVDIAANLVESARHRARIEGISARFDEGDAEALPYADTSFNLVISLIGAMFAPRPERVCSKIARVLRPGGALYMANWTPSSMPAQMFKAVAAVAPPPPGVAPPVLWGDEDTVRERLDAEFTDIELRRINYPQWHYPFDAGRLTELFRSHFGPVKRAFDVADEKKAQQLFKQLQDIFDDHGEFDGKTLTITRGELLLVCAKRR